MKIYRNDYRDRGQINQGFSFHTTLSSAHGEASVASHPGHFFLTRTALSLDKKPEAPFIELVPALA
jgi:hypothetical protein